MTTKPTPAMLARGKFAAPTIKPADYAQSADGSVRVTFEMITPAIAEAYLAKNTNNRTLSKYVALTYATDMEAERWWLNTDAIGFDNKGTLMNGQHRLQAVIDSNKTVEMMVVYGLDLQARATTDVGRKRTVADELKMRGITNNNQMAASVRMRLQYENRSIGISQTARFTNQEIIDAAGEWNDDFQEAVAKAKQVYHNVKVSPTVLACAYSIFHGIDPDLADHYYDKLATAENVSGTILTVMKRLQREKNSVAKLQAPHVLWVLIRGWNAIRKGEKPLERMILPEVVTGLNMMIAL